MRLLFVVKTLGPRGGRGGAERVLSVVTSGLSARGHEVSVVTFDPPGESEVYSFAPAIEQIKLGVGIAHKNASFRDTIARVAALRRTVTAWKPDVAVGFMHSAYVALGLALIGTGIPAIASEHIVYRHYKKLPLQRLSLQLIPFLFKRITTISSDVRREFPYNIRRNMDVIPNPVSDALGRANPAASFARKIILNVGRLMAQKDQRTLIAAFARLSDRYPDWDLHIVGEGILRPELAAQIASLGLDQRVKLLGAMADVSKQYLEAQLFVISSSFESFGLVTAEAMTHGLPAIGFADCPGTNELIEDGINGLLAEGTDRVTALSTAMDRLMGSPELREKLGARGPESMSRFSPEVVLGLWEQLLESTARRK